MKNKFYINLEILRVSGGFSKSSFARHCGLKQTTMLGYLNNTSQPNLENLIAIAEANNTTVAWLIGEENERPKNGTVHAHLPNKSMQEMAAWINEQDDGIDYWEAAKARFAHDYPEFREWLKKRAAQRGESTFPIDKSVNGDE